MKQSIKCISRSCFLAAAVVLLLAACNAGTPQKAENNTELDAIAQRAVNRWKALIAHDYAVAYPYYTPGFRSKQTLLQFVDSFPGSRVVWTDASYYDHECEAAKCNVRMDITYAYLNPAPGVDRQVNHRLVNETWLFIDGEWYYSP